MITGVVPSFPRFLPSIFIAHRVPQSHCSWIFHRVLLPHALALSANQFVRKKKPPRIYTSMHSGGFELTKLTYTRLEDNLTRHRGDRLYQYPSVTPYAIIARRYDESFRFIIRGGYLNNGRSQSSTRHSAQIISRQATYLYRVLPGSFFF